MLQVKHVSCGYDKYPVVKDVSVSLEEGERLCILGPNGCGKTTFLRALAGILPYSGEITVCGESLKGMKRRQAAQKIALMSQLSSYSFSYTVYETVMLGRYAHMKRGLLGGENSEDRRIVLESMERTGTLELKDRLITELSGGQLQRVFLARVFAQDPQIILLDEPTNHLDLKYQIELIEYLKEWSLKGKRCVAGVLHDINLALAFADTLLLMDEGRVQAVEKTDHFDFSLLSRTYHMDVQDYMRKSLKRWE
ncbi:ABC transporter ATP-binding protein [Lachnotalea sp. AF33-28]|nr:ABC transporter ATP-binding protein [Lachnotalea sp. AF33-28]